jgi:hypothetical protein
MDPSRSIYSCVVAFLTAELEAPEGCAAAEVAEGTIPPLPLAGCAGSRAFLGTRVTSKGLRRASEEPR